MACILIIAPDTSYRIASYLAAARVLDLDVLLAAHGPHAPVDPRLAGGIRIDLHTPDADLQTLLTALRDRRVDGVIGTDDSTVELASRAATALGLPHNSPEAARYSRRKDLARARLRRAGLPAPAYRVLDLDLPLAPQLEDLDYPCVVKPVALSGSRGVIRADNQNELLAACARTAALLDQLKEQTVRDRLLVETFVPGPEVAIEGMLHRGKLSVLAMFDKPEPLDGPFFEETYYTTPSRHSGELLAQAVLRTGEACAAFDLTEGPVHAELRLHEDEAWLLDLAARTIGGQCARLFDFGTGQSLEELVLAQAVGRPLAPRPMAEAGGVLMIPIPKAGVLRRVEGVMAASRIPHIEELVINLREGHRLAPLPEGDRYLGFIFARAPSAEAAEAALRAAHACLKIVIAPLFELKDLRQ